MKKVIDTKTLSSIADAIREKEKSESPIRVSDFAERILNIAGGSNVEINVVDVVQTESSTTSRRLFNGRIIEHGLSVPPNLVLVVRDGDDIPPLNTPLMYLTLLVNGAFGLFPFCYIAGYDGGNSNSYPRSFDDNASIDNEFVTFKNTNNNKSELQKDVNYKFIFMHI